MLAEPLNHANIIYTHQTSPTFLWYYGLYAIPLISRHQSILKGDLATKFKHTAPPPMYYRVVIFLTLTYFKTLIGNRKKIDFIASNLWTVVVTLGYLWILLITCGHSSTLSDNVLVLVQ